MLQFEWYRECFYTRLKASALGRFFILKFIGKKV